MRKLWVAGLLFGCEPTDKSDADTFTTPILDGGPSTDTEADADTDADSDSDADSDADTDTDTGTVVLPVDCTAGGVWVDEVSWYAGLQEALNAASTGSVVRICPGTYTGTFTAPVPMTLRSDSGNPSNTILDGAGAGTALAIQADSTVEGLKITGGQGGYARAAGLHLASEGALTVSNCLIEENAGDGIGGLFVGSNSTVTVTGSMISNNLGSGIFCTSSTLTLTDTRVEQNVHDGGLGGGLNAQFCTVTGGTWADNEAEWGGGIHLFVSNLSGAEVTGNFAHSAGGGIYISELSPVSDTTVTFNEVPPDLLWETGAGIDINSYDTNPLTNVVIEDNLGPALGTQIFSVISLEDCTIRRNQGGFTWWELYLYPFHGSLTSVNTDWGAGADDNGPYDVSWYDGVDYLGYEAAEDFTCNVVCDPVP